MGHKDRGHEILKSRTKKKMDENGAHCEHRLCIMAVNNGSETPPFAHKQNRCFNGSGPGRTGSRTGPKLAQNVQNLSKSIYTFIQKNKIETHIKKQFPKF